NRPATSSPANCPPSPTIVDSTRSSVLFRSPGTGTSNGSQLRIAMQSLLLRRLVARGWFDDFEIRALDLSQLLVQRWDSRIGRRGDCPLDAVVGDEHAITLESHEDRFHFRREAGHVEV